MPILLKEICSSFNKFRQYFAQKEGFLIKRRQYANEIIGICKFFEKSLSSRDLISQNANMGGGGGGWLGQNLMIHRKYPKLKRDMNHCLSTRRGKGWGF